MGARFSVKFANIYMYMWFRKFNASFDGFLPPFIARLIDDCFFIWRHSEDELKLYFQFLNSRHATIKFQCNYSTDRVTFLDTITYVDNGVIKTTVYCKPTDKKQYLFFTSAHPRHIFHSVPYSQGIRYRRIIDDDELLSSEITNLHSKFERRGYPSQLLLEQFSKALRLDRTILLQYRTSDEKRASFARFLRGRSFLPLIISYHSSLASRSFRSGFVELWKKFSTCHSDINKVFGCELPQIVFKRGRTIGSVLVKTKLQSIPTSITDRENISILAGLLDENSPSRPCAVNRCLIPRCKCCQCIITESFFHGQFFDL